MVRLLINNGELDLSEDFKISLNYSISDVSNLSKKATTFSKTITLPGTHNNNYLLGNIFDINSDYTLFNINRKTDATLVDDGDILIDGFLKLERIKKTPYNDRGGYDIYYEISMNNKSIDLISNLGDKTLNELDLEIYNHTYSVTNIEDSWSNTSGYVYPMYGLHYKDVNNKIGNSYEVENFFPAMFLKTVVDQIFLEGGYAYDGSLLTNDQYLNEIIPYMTDSNIKATDIQLARREFIAYISDSDKLIGDVALNNKIGESIIEYGDIYDPYSLWSSYFDFDVSGAGDYSFGLTFSYKFKLKNEEVSDFYLSNNLSNGGTFSIIHSIQKADSGSGTWSTILNIRKEVLAPLSITASTTLEVETIDFGFNTPVYNLAVGDRIRVIYEIYKNGFKYTNPNTPGTYPKAYIDQIGSYFWNTPLNGSIGEGNLLSISSILSSKIKQKDLINDLIRRYNLYIFQDEDNYRLLHMYSRDDFYNLSNDLDWSDKKDNSSNDEIDFIINTQNKEVLLTYKNDSDYYNKNYNELIGENYGQYKYSFDNDFIQGEMKIESIFSPTPLVETVFGAVVPSIDPVVPKGNPRILYYGGLKSSKTNWTFNSIPQSYYPYAGHLDDYTNPSLDINFGWCKYLFYSDVKRTPFNMFNNYWSNYIYDVEEGKILKTSFYLTKTDIANIKDKLYSKIWVDDAWYVINKIINYNPLENSLTEVELITISNKVNSKSLKYLKSDIREIDSNGDAFSDVNNSIGTGNKIGRSYITKNITYLGTTYSIVNMDSSFVVGNDNTVGYSGIVVGNNNRVSSPNSNILGGNNNIVDSSAILIGCDNLIVSTQSNPTTNIFLGNNLKVDNEGNLIKGDTTFQIERFETTATLSSASWSYVTASTNWEYTYNNSNITNSTMVDIIPDQAYVSIASAAVIYSQIIIATGSATLKATNQPTGDIGASINIY